MSDDRQYMGTPDEARAKLVDRARKWRQYRQPSMATAAEHKKRDILEHEAQFQLANAALLWLWHEENPDPSAIDPAAFMEEVREVLGPLAQIAEHDIGSDETDSDLYRPMDARYAVAEPVKVGHLRAACALLEKMEGK